MRKVLALLFCVALGLTACRGAMTDSRYDRNLMGRKKPTYIGTVVAMNTINVAGTSEASILAGTNTGDEEKAAPERPAVEFSVELKYNGQIVAIVQSNELNLQVGDQVIVAEIDGQKKIRQKI